MSKEWVMQFIALLRTRLPNFFTKDHPISDFQAKNKPLKLLLEPQLRANWLKIASWIEGEKKSNLVFLIPRALIFSSENLDWN